MKKKIAMILPNYKGGGMPKVAETISVNLDESKYEQTLIILSSDTEKRYKFNGESINISKSGKNLISKILINMNRTSRLRKIKKEQNYDAVISFGVQSNVLNIITQNKEKVICTEHNIKSIENRTWGIKGKIYNYLMKKYYNKSDRLVAISKVMKKDLKDNYGIKDVEVIYNPHEINHIVQKAREKIEDEHNHLFYSGPVLITVGRLSHAKSQKSIIKVMKEIVVNTPTAKLLILGEGELKDELKEMVKKLNLENNVFS